MLQDQIPSLGETKDSMGCSFFIYMCVQQVQDNPKWYTDKSLIINASALQGSEVMVPLLNMVKINFQLILAGI